MTTENVLASDQIPAFVTKTFNHYFGNYNYIKDKFLQEQAKVATEGWIPLSIFEKFNKVAEYVKNADYRPQLIEGLKAGDDFVFDEEKLAVRRNPEKPVPESTIGYWQSCKDRTAYFKGFPKDSTLEELIAYSETYGMTESVNRRFLKESNEFKGSLFVIYNKLEDVAKALAGEEKFRGEIAIERSLRSDWQKKKEAERKEKTSKDKGMKENKNKKTAETVAAPVVKIGNVLQLTGLPQKTNVNTVKEFFKKFGDCAFVQIEGEGNAKVRFGGDSDNVGKTSLEAALAAGEGKLNIFDDEAANVEGRVLTDEENTAYWKEYLDTRNQKSSGGGRSFGGGRGGRGGNRGGNRGRGGKFQGKNDRRNKDGEESNDRKRPAGDGGADVETKKSKEETN
uniref:Lupus La protein n=1 Tax=Rhabditophanes sp. KR3021 TaxID=114890 RepID=A0AC35U8Y4_9BILA